MTGVGVFGKIPGHGDFVSAGTGTATGRAFEKWLQMANDRVAESGKALPQGPIGFIFRDEEASSALVGTMVASRDKVGRKFPLALFAEVMLALPAAEGGIGYGAGTGLRFPALPSALTGAIVRFADASGPADDETIDAFKKRTSEISTPGQAEVARATQTHMKRLDRVQLGHLLSRMHGAGNARYYATEVVLRACAGARRAGARNPVAVDFKVGSDVELLFCMACVEAACGPAIVAPSVFWDVSTSRLVVALGTPDSNALNFFQGGNVQYQRLWPTVTTSAESAERARTRLNEACAGMLQTPGSAAAGEFVEWIRSWVAGGAEVRE